MKEIAQSGYVRDPAGPLDIRAGPSRPSPPLSGSTRRAAPVGRLGPDPDPPPGARAPRDGSAVRVLLVEDHTLVREGLRVLLQSSGGLEIVGEAANGRQAVELAEKLRPGVVVMDIAMPVLNGFEATRQILELAPATRVLVLSAHGEDEYVQRMAAAGAVGYVLKHASGEELVRAVRAVARGRSYFSAGVERRRDVRVRRARESGERFADVTCHLTAREAEVLQRVAEGAPNKRIAAELGISIKTVEKHRQQLMDKLDIHETAGLTRHAIATGVIESGVEGRSR